MVESRIRLNRFQNEDTRTREELNVQSSYGRKKRIEVTNALKTQRRLLYLKTQLVPRSKHFPSRL
jgi:hypothetical protein